MSYWNFLFINIDIVGKNYDFSSKKKESRCRRKKKKIKEEKERQNPFNKLHFPVLMLFTFTETDCFASNSIHQIALKKQGRSERSFETWQDFIDRVSFLKKKIKGKWTHHILRDVYSTENWRKTDVLQK